MEAPAKTEIAIGLDGIVRDVSATEGFARVARLVSVGDCAKDYVHPDDHDLFELMLYGAPERGGRIAKLGLRWSRSDNRWAHLIARFRTVDNGTVLIALVNDDIGAARHSAEQMRRVVEGSAQGIVVRTATEILYMNEAFAKLLGFASLKECINASEPVDSGIHPDDLPLVIGHMKARISGEEAISHYEFRLLRRDGSVVWVETFAAIVDWDGQPASLSWLSDITERKKMQSEIIKSKEEAEFSNRTKTEFLANMSHELRTPLNAILGFSEIMSRRMFGPLGDRYADYALDIHRSGEHLLELVNDVLDLSKLEAGRLELRESEIVVADAIEEAIRLVRKRAGEAEIELHSEIREDFPALCADQRSVRQVLLNLLTNAIKFTPAKGAATVIADIDDENRICLSVKDTGVGMSEHEIKVALAPFGRVDSDITHKQEGTGLGLPISKSLMQLHDGELIIVSRPNEGTTLTARFPARRTLPLQKVANL